VTENQKKHKINRISCIRFLCLVPTRNCIGFEKKFPKEKGCKYHSYGYCTSKIVQINRMVLSLKDEGIEVGNG